MASDAPPLLSIHTSANQVKEEETGPAVRRPSWVSFLSFDATSTASLTQFDLDSTDEGEQMLSEPLLEPANRIIGDSEGQQQQQHERTNQEEQWSASNNAARPSSSSKFPMNPHHHHQLSADEDLEAVNTLLFQGSAAGFLLWAVLVLLVFLVPPEESFEYVEGSEKQACWTFLFVLFATNGSRLGPLIFGSDGLDFFKSGLLVGSFTIQAIALVSNWLMVAVPTPILVDPITGMRIHLLRNVSWIPLAFIMTFLTEAIDLKSQAPYRKASNATSVAWWHAIAMTATTAGGAIFPFCTNKYVWWMVMLNSWTLFSSIFVRLYQRYSRHQTLLQQQEQQQRQHAQAHATNSKKQAPLARGLDEAVDRAHSAYKMILLCTISWTAIAVTFTVCTFCSHYATKDPRDDMGLLLGFVSFLASDDTSLLLGFGCEGVSKIWYLSLQIHVYEKVFDESARAVRRLEEMRELMSTLWEASSDVLVVCAESETAIHAVVSPNPLLKEESWGSNGSNTSTLLEIDIADGSFFSFPMDLSEPVTRKDADRVKAARLMSDSSAASCFSLCSSIWSTTKEKNLSILAKLAYQVCCQEHQWHTGNPDLPMQEMHKYQPETGKEIRIKCEANAAPIDTGGVLLTLRDVSERYRRFEVEKQLLEQVIVRKKDAEAIRFTRHEVKNGLLAAIGIVDAMKEEKWDLSNPQAQDTHIHDLDVALNETLGAILDNAMMREVVYEGFMPRRESVDLPALLGPRQRVHSSCGEANAFLNTTSSRQFPLFVSPEPFPWLDLDPQLIRKIYQNAVSNACKYGQKDGDVKTLLSYEAQIFKMQVVNLPGYRHEALLELTKEEVNAVFQESTQLKINQCLTEEGKFASARSAGDGAWIMQKCAHCLGGKCEISYDENGTTLSFECPAEISDEWRQRLLDASSLRKEAFALPETTWAVAIDDSPVQQKLLGRFLKQAGIANERCVVLGKSAEEIFAFEETVQSLMKDNPEDKFLLIVDENLDVFEGGALTSTVSGSFSVKKLRDSFSRADERRMLSLIRSANDSVEEVELYKSRAHGFLLKGPMRKGGLLQEIKPWWDRRFPSCDKPEEARSKTGKLRRNTSYLGNLGDDFGVTRARILELVKRIDALCGYHPLDTCEADPSSQSTPASWFKDWQSIRYKLLLLNVDLKIHSSRDLLALAAKAIDDLTGHRYDGRSDRGGMPSDLLRKWIEIRGLTTRGVEDEEGNPNLSVLFQSPEGARGA